MESRKTSGIFGHRRPDKRLVKQITTLLHQPTHWLPMDIQENECKLMEVRKYSAAYYDIDAKFRRPNLELITAYTVQNPFNFGMFQLRKEQLKMQLSSLDPNEKVPLKEQEMYFPAKFSNLELIARNNFFAVSELSRRSQKPSRMKPTSRGTKFFSNSELANSALNDPSNPRVMIVARVLTGVCEEVDLAASVLPFFNENGYAVDTFRNGAKTELLKVNPNEAYPNFVLVYRDLEGDADFRSSRLTEDVIKHAQISYRAGTRFNPEEIEFKGLENRQREQEAKKKKNKFKSSSSSSAITTQPKRELSEEESTLASSSVLGRKTGAVPKRARAGAGGRGSVADIATAAATKEKSVGETDAALNKKNDGDEDDESETPLLSQNEESISKLTIVTAEKERKSKHHSSRKAAKSTEE